MPTHLWAQHLRCFAELPVTCSPLLTLLTTAVELSHCPSPPPFIQDYYSDHPYSIACTTNSHTPTPDDVVIVGAVRTACCKAKKGAFKVRSGRGLGFM